jgi:hypothetical protein
MDTLSLNWLSELPPELLRRDAKVHRVYGVHTVAKTGRLINFIFL